MTSTRKIAKRKFRPSCEGLEDRNLLTTVQPYLSGGLQTYTGHSTAQVGRPFTYYPLDEFGIYTNPGPNSTGYTVDWGDGNVSYGTIAPFSWGDVAHVGSDYLPDEWVDGYSFTFNATGILDGQVGARGALNLNHSYASNGNYLITISMLGLQQYDDVSVSGGHPAELLYDGSPTGPFNDVIGDRFVTTVVAASGKTIGTVDWTFENNTNGVPNVIDNQVVTSSGGYINIPFGTNGSLTGSTLTTLSEYWGQYGGQEMIQARLHYLDGTTEDLFDFVNIVQPSGSLNVISTGTPTLIPGGDGSVWLSTGADLATAPGIKYLAEVDPTTTGGIEGNVAVTQIVDWNSFYKLYNTFVGGPTWSRTYFREATTPNRQRLLDNLYGSSTVFYADRVGFTTDPIVLEDTPQLPLEPKGLLTAGDFAAVSQASFTDYLMYQPVVGPAGKGIWVPIGKQSWSFDINWNSTYPDRVNVVHPVHLTSEYASTATYPVWDQQGAYYGNPAHPIWYDRLIG